MKAMSLLSKFLGRYDDWKKLRERHGLRWATNDNFIPLFSLTPFPKLLEDARNMINALAGRFPHEVEFMALSGLRPAEAIMAIKVFKMHREDYFNTELKVLEHFRFPQVFFRRCKRAFITVLNDHLLMALEKAAPITYNMLRMYLRRRGMRPCFNVFRKLFATFLRQKGLEAELVDYLQGRVPNTVFMRHYFSPDVRQVVEKVRALLPELRELLFNGVYVTPRAQAHYPPPIPSAEQTGRGRA